MWSVMILHFLTQMSPPKLPTPAALSRCGVICFMELCQLESIHSAEIGQYLCGPGSVVEVEIKSEKTGFTPNGVSQCSLRGRQINK